MVPGLTEFRYAATPKRLRALLGGQTVLDTREALLVYEPRRVVPWYAAIPPGDLRLDLTEHDPFPVPELRAPVLPPHHNEWHTVPGRSLHLEGHGEVAFRPDEPDLGGRVVLHWDPFEWLEEDEPVMGHPHDPCKRMDVLRSSRHVRVEVGGVTVADSSRPMMLIETALPVRWYLPRQDVRMELLTSSENHTVCAYKGVASTSELRALPTSRGFTPNPSMTRFPSRTWSASGGPRPCMSTGVPWTPRCPVREPTPHHGGSRRRRHSVLLRLERRKDAHMGARLVRARDLAPKPRVTLSKCAWQQLGRRSE